MSEANTNLQILLEPTKRDQVVADLSAAIESSVSSSSGVSGMALKTLLSGAQKVKSDIVPKATNRILPELLETLQPHWDGYLAGQDHSAGNFAAYLDNNSATVVDGLLAVVDRNVEKVEIAPAVKGYRALRSKASGLVTPHLAQLGDVIERHMTA